MSGDDLLSRALARIRENRIFPDGCRVLGAVSGGPDSVFLCLVLSALASSNRLSYSLAYIHHGLRKEADAEQEFVKNLAASLGVPFHCRRVRIRRMANVEETARLLRYKALAGIARKTGCSAIATGHQLDDQAETLLMNLLRGSGLRGLGAMRRVSPCPSAPDIRLVRPLLPFSRADIESHLRIRRVRFLTDRSNRSRRFQRNRIRLEVLPILSRLAPSATENIARTASLLADDHEFLRKAAASSLDRLRLPPFAHVRLRRDGLARLHPAVGRLVVRQALEETAGGPASYGDIERVRQAATAVGTARFAVKGSAMVTVGRRVVSFSPPNRPRRAIPKAVRVVPAGDALLPEFALGLRFRTVAVSPEVFNNPNPMTAHFRPESLVGALTVRFPRDGDVFRPLGTRRRMELSRFLRDAGLDRQERALAPILACGRRVLWAIGIRQSECGKVLGGDRRAVRCIARFTPDSG